MRLLRNKIFIIASALYFAWIAFYSMFYVNTVFMDTTYFLIEDIFGIGMLYILYSILTSRYDFERMVVLILIAYKIAAVISEFLMYFNIFINPDWWAIYATFGLFSILAVWIHLKGK